MHIADGTTGVVCVKIEQVCSFTHRSQRLLCHFPHSCSNYSRDTQFGLRWIHLAEISKRVHVQHKKDVAYIPLLWLEWAFAQYNDTSVQNVHKSKWNGVVDKSVCSVITLQVENWLLPSVMFVSSLESFVLLSSVLGHPGPTQQKTPGYVYIFTTFLKLALRDNEAKLLDRTLLILSTTYWKK